MKLTQEEKLIREYLIEIAKKNEYTVYSELCDEIWNRCGTKLDMSIPEHRGRIGSMLGHISRYENEEGRPMLSALVITESTGKPGSGFYKLAEDLGLYTDSMDEKEFSDAEGDRAVAFWQSH